MKNSMRPWLICATSMMLSNFVCAGEPGQQHGGVCSPTVKVEKVDDYCWEVRSKEICIPPVQFPWQKKFGGGKGKGDGCCAEPSSHGGKIRRVKFLWQRPLENQECVYEWNVVYPGKGKCAPQAGAAPPADGDEEVPAPPPVTSAQSPANARVR